MWKELKWGFLFGVIALVLYGAIFTALPKPEASAQQVVTEQRADVQFFEMRDFGTVVHLSKDMQKWFKEENPRKVVQVMLLNTRLGQAIMVVYEKKK